MKTYLTIIILISMISCNSQSLNDKLREAILKNIDNDAKKMQYKTDSLIVVKVDTLTQSRMNLLLIISCDEKVKSNSLNAEIAIKEIKLLELSLENKIVNGIDKKTA